MIEFAWPAVVLATALLGTTAALHAWRGWLELKRYQIDREHGADGVEPSSRSRIEMAAIKERLRKLEEIATGVDL